MLDNRRFKEVAATAGRVLGAPGGESARAGFFMDMLAKWLWQEKSELLEVSSNGVDIHEIDEAAAKFCEYFADKGTAGFSYEENPTRFIPTLRMRSVERIKLHMVTQ